MGPAPIAKVWAARFDGRRGKMGSIDWIGGCLCFYGDDWKVYEAGVL